MDDQLWRTVLTAGMTILLCVGSSKTMAQEKTTYTVTVADKNRAHPNEGQGWAEGYSIDLQQGKPLMLIRGISYTFHMDNVPAEHPFYMSTNEIGLGQEPFGDGVEGNFVTGDGSLTFTPDENTPDRLFYQCSAHERMGWEIHVVDMPEVGLADVAQGLTSPIALVDPSDGSDRLFIVDQAGLIRIVDPAGRLLDEPFLDVRDQMVELQEGFDERGLLGLAFHPQFASNGRLFVYYSAPLRSGAPAGWDHTATFSEFLVAGDDQNSADPESERVFLEIDSPQVNHNGGTLAFGADGYLYMSVGDGGGANDIAEGHEEDWYDVNQGGNAQNVEANLLGKILRVDVDNGDPYGIPADNPFLGRDGLDEIYAYGFRNPYRFSFDLQGDHDLIVGDVGQLRWEEVNVVERGGNYGWNVWEGTHCFSTDNPQSDLDDCPAVVEGDHPDEGESLILPVIEYANSNNADVDGLGEALIGGVFYRGSDLPEFAGRYIFGDWSESDDNPSGRLFIATRTDEGRWPFTEIRAVNQPGGLEHRLLALANDAEGEVYVLTTDMSGPTGSTGRVYRMVSPEAVSGESPPELPLTAVLEQNYPNPFNPTTTIRFEVDRTGPVTLTVFDMLGRHVVTLIDGEVPTGAHSAEWNGTDESGRRLSSGTYVYRLETASATESRVMTLLK